MFKRLIDCLPIDKHKPTLGGKTMSDEMYLERFCFAEFGTYGVLTIDGERFYTVEPPHIVTDEYPHGKPSESCIPKGRYPLQPHHGTKYPDTWAMVNPDLGVYQNPNNRKSDIERFACVLHAANIPGHVEGCIGPGQDIGYLEGVWAVIHSSEAMSRVKELLSAKSKPVLVITHKIP